jgi:hypothetical protein
MSDFDRMLASSTVLPGIGSIIAPSHSLSGFGHSADGRSGSQPSPGPAPNPPPNAPGAGGPASGGFFFFGFAAVLALLLLLAAQSLGRRLERAPVRCRPVLFLSLLERPG